MSTLKTHYDVNKCGKNGETYKSGNETAQIIDNELNDKKPSGSKSGNSATKAATKTTLKKPRTLAKSTLKTDTEQPAEPPYQRKKNIVLASGVRWVQKGEMYDPALGYTRHLTMDEWDELLSLGLRRPDFEGWAPGLPFEFEGYIEE